jgi:hypothetical protein
MNLWTTWGSPREAKDIHRLSHLCRRFAHSLALVEKSNKNKNIVLLYSGS